jgi:DNA-binding MarR family transcriptional regulator
VTVFFTAHRQYPVDSFSKVFDLMKEFRERISNSSDSSSHEADKTLWEVETILRELEERFSELERSVSALALLRLTAKQERILKWLKENNEEEIVYTRMVNVISKEFNMPESTARWNLRILREAALLEAGDRANKGIPVKLTEAGRIALDVISVENLLRNRDDA